MFNEEAFQLSFWAGLLSGFIYSIFVGFVIWFVQLLAEKRRVKNDCKRDVAKFSKELKVALNYPPIILIESNLKEYLPKSMLEPLLLIQKHPIEYWQNILENNDLLQKCSEYLDSYRELTPTIATLEGLIKYHQQEEISHIDWNTRVQIQFNILYGGNLDLFKTWFPKINENDFNSIKKNFELFRENYRTPVDFYRDGVKKMIGLSDELRSILNEV